MFLATFVLLSGIAGADDRSFANEMEFSGPSTMNAGEIANMTITVLGTGTDGVNKNWTVTTDELRYYPYVEKTVGARNVTT